MLGLVNQRKALQRKLNPEKKAFGDSAADKAEAERDRVAVPPEWSDFEYFATQTKARTSTGVRKIELFEWQKELAKIIDKENVVVTKSRQTGASQFLIIYSLWFALTHPGCLVLVMSKSFKSAGELTRRMRRAITGLNHPCAEPLSDSLSLVHFPNDSQIAFSSASPPEKAARGLAQVDICFADECAWAADLRTTLGTLGPALSASDTRRLVLLSTPNGRTGAYWDQLIDGIGAEGLERELEKVRNGYYPGYATIRPEEGRTKFIVHWSAVARYKDEENFLERMQKEFSISEATMLREFQLDFTDAAANIFDFNLVQSCLGPKLDPKAEPKDGWVYWMGVDPSGLGQDYAVALVIGESPDRTIEVVDISRKRTGSSAQHLSAVVRLSEKWGVSEVSVESNSMGQTWAETLAASPKMPRVTATATTFTSKPVMIGRIIIAMEGGQLAIPEESILYKEMLAFQQVGTQMQAAPGHHDDAVMALAIATHISGLNASIKRFPGKIEVMDDDDDFGDLLDLG